MPTNSGLPPILTRAEVEQMRQKQIVWLRSQPADIQWQVMKALLWDQGSIDPNLDLALDQRLASYKERLDARRTPVD